MSESLERAVRFTQGAIDRLASLGVEADRDASALLDERSSFTGWAPSGRVSAGGSCHLLPTMDGWCAVNLPRPDDLELLPAWLGVTASDGATPWPEIAAAVASRSSEVVVADAQVLGLAVSRLPTADDDEQLAFRGTTNPARPWLVRRAGDAAAARSLEGLKVVDLSSLWAGPLCARFLGRAGAEVVKVESKGRPDGARSGDPGFWSQMLDGHEQRSIDFTTDDGRAELNDLIAGADIVIEQSRPRAFDRLGVVPADVVAARPGSVWLSITAYGRCGPWNNHVGFGDDTAVAGGLVDRHDGSPAFVGDAIADPLTGVTAAALVASAVRSGGGVTVDVALREVARSVASGMAVVW